MKIAKILIAGIVVTAFDVIVGMFTCGGIFNWVYKIAPTYVWKPMDAPPDAIFYIGVIVLNIILASVYALINKGIPGKSRLVKGAVFGLVVWLIGVLPGMFATHSFMTVAVTVLVYWTILDLVTNPLKGIIIAAIYGE